MFCKYCGTLISDDSRFCSCCGKDLYISNTKSVGENPQPVQTADQAQTAYNQTVPTTSQTQAAYNQTVPTASQAQTAYNQTVPTTSQAQTAYNQTVPTASQAQTAYNQAPYSNNLQTANQTQAEGYFNNIQNNGSMSVQNTNGNDSFSNVQTGTIRPDTSFRRPIIVVKDGFFFRHLSKGKKIALIIAAVFLALWTASVTVSIFFPQYINFI